ncbi:MAG: hypothetical protein K6E28_00300 [Eubacterium sp.]|nr:hypothetical protein [Eubacterium sp.]
MGDKAVYEVGEIVFGATLFVSTFTIDNLQIDEGITIINGIFGMIQ